MIIHLFPNSTFAKPFIDFINKNFECNEHSFIIYGSSDISYIDDASNITCVNKTIKDLLKITIKANKSDKVILHGLFNRLIIMFLLFQPLLLKKCYWVIWGGDLYYHVMKENTIKSNLYEYLRKFVIKKFNGFITHIRGDYELAKKWYGFKGKHYYSFMYPSNLYKEYSLTREKKANARVSIQVGNSADPSNNHIEIIRKLERYKNKDIEIFCPLSYGNKDYAKQVINYGSKIFGEKFIPIIEFIPFDKYLETLIKVDVAIFNHKRQQAMGNITTLLGLGKKVYIREDITTWQFCIDHDLKVYSANSKFDDLFEEMDEEIKHKNIENVKAKFSEEKLVEDLKKIFDEEII